MGELICGRYRITGKLGEGGMAEVYLATHELIAQEAAIKLLHRHMSVHQSVVKRFLQEAQASAAIKHPGIVAIYDVGYTADGRAYIVMERLRGETLNARLKRLGQFSIHEARSLIRQLAGVMDAAHAQKIIHRDLKPDNLFIVADPEVPGGERLKVLDFGLAKLVSEFQGSLVTAQGSVFGTPSYMAPEQCRDSGNVDERADLYSIGCIFYACLCGAPPFRGPDPLAILSAQLSHAPVPPAKRRPEIPGDLDALIMRLLEKSPDHRVQSCAELIAMLDGVVSPAGLTSIKTTLVFAREPGPAAGQPEEATFIEVDSAPCQAAAPGWPESGAASPPRPEPHPGMQPASAMQEPPNRPARQSKTPVAAQPPMMPALATSSSMPSANISELRSHRDDEREQHRRQIRILIVACVGLVLVGISLGALWTRLDPNDAPRPKAPISISANATPVGDEQANIYAEHLERAHQAIKARNWSRALEALDQALELAPGRPEQTIQVEELRARAVEGKTHQALFTGLQEALSAGDIDAVLARIVGIPPHSAYHGDAESAIEEAAETLTGTARAHAKELVQARKCDALAAWLDELEQGLPHVHANVSALRETCGKGATPPPDSSKASDELSPEQMQSYLTEAKAAYGRSDYARAHASCRKILKADRGHAEANLWCALSMCQQKKVKQVKRYYRRISAKDQGMVRQACLKMGIDPAPP